MIIQFILVFVLFFLLFNIIPKYKYLYVLKGTNLITEGNVEKGLLMFEKGIDSNKVDYMTKIRYAFLELKFGDIKKAKRTILRILSEKIPNAVRYEAKAIFAIVLFKEGDSEEAKETMLSVYENYKNTNMYCTLGYLFNILETPENAVKFNEEAYEYNNDHAVILDNLGQAYYLLNENKKALNIYEEVMSKEPNFPEAYYNFALVLLKEGEKEEARKMLDKALTKPFHNLTTVTKEEVETKLVKI